MERISLPIRTKFEKIEQINEEFTKCKCYIMAIGKNRNGSHFSRKAVEDAIPTFKNIPVIAFLYEGDDGQMHVAGHEMKLVERDGKDQWHTKCIPYGTVPDGAFTFEEVTESNGTKATYLTAEVILWSGKYPEIMDAAYSESVYFSQSMEIKCLETKQFAADPSYIDITKFSASALCLLGKSDEAEYNVTPCFPSSSVVPYSFDEQFSTLMDELKFALSNCFSNKDDNGCEVKTLNKEMIDAILAEFNLKVEDIDFEINENTSEEELREQLKAYMDHQDAEPDAESDFKPDADHQEESEENSEENEDDADAEPMEQMENHEESYDNADNLDDNSNVAPTATVEFSSTYTQRREAIYDALNAIAIRDDANDHYVFYYPVDFTDEYIYVEKYEYNNGVDGHSYGRFSYVFEDENKTAVVNGDFVEMFVKWLTQDELDAIGRERDEFEAYKATHTTENSVVEELQAFKHERLAEDHRIAVADVLAQFSDLIGVKEFDDYSMVAEQTENISEIEEKCFAIRGRTMKTPSAKNKIEKNESRMPIIKEHFSADPNCPYVDLFEKYGHTPKSHKGA